MNRRTFVKALTATSVTGLTALPRVQAAVPKMKITRVRVYTPPNPNPLFNQSDSVVTIETDSGVTGIGEGGSKQMLEQCAGRLIGKCSAISPAVCSSSRTRCRISRLVGSASARIAASIVTSVKDFGADV